MMKSRSEVQNFEYTASRDVMESMLEERILAEVPFDHTFHEDFYLHHGVKLLRQGFYADDILEMLYELYVTARYVP